jgi:hypothetical protein
MYPDCYPIIGGTKISQLQSNIDALKIHLTPDQMDKLSNAVPFDWGFPYDFFGRDPHGLPGGTTDSPLFNTVSATRTSRVQSTMNGCWLSHRNVETGSKELMKRW